MRAKDIEVRSKITIRDILEVVDALERRYAQYYGMDRLPLQLVKAILSIYAEYIGKRRNEIDLGMEENRPQIFRSEVIRRYRKKEPDAGLIEDYRTHKYIANKKLKELMLQSENGRSLNPKCLVLKVSARKNEGEYANYFVSIKPPKPIPPRIKQEPPPLSSEQILKIGMEKWEKSGYLGQNALSKQDLIRIESEINPAGLDEKSLAYIMVSAIFSHQDYEGWWKQCGHNEAVVWHVLNLLPQLYRKPFWRAAFILQCADPQLFTRAVSRLQKEGLGSEQLKKALKHIKAKTVRSYLLKCIEERSFLVEPYATVLLREFRDFNCKTG